MKNPYFTDDTIGAKSREMLDRFSWLREVRPLNFKCDQSALIILDMQDYFLNEKSHAFIPSARPIIPKIVELATTFVGLKLPVILTRHVNTDDDAGMLGEWWSDVITGDGGMSEIITELINILDTTIVKKIQYDAFYETDLEEILRERDVKQVVITGVMSHLCCETTARSAFVRGFEVYFTIDGTATYSEEHHLATLLNLSHGFAHPVLVDELLNLLELYTLQD